jgi:hypothetical protein
MSNRLNPGDQLKPGQQLVSDKGGIVLRMEEGGNAVLVFPGNNPTWATGTDGHPGSMMVMQTDGNLVVLAPGKGRIWQSCTAGNPRSVLILQEQGNIVIYAPGMKAIWDNFTPPRGGPPPTLPPIPQPIKFKKYLCKAVNVDTGEVRATTEFEAPEDDASKDCNHFAKQFGQNYRGDLFPKE